MLNYGYQGMVSILDSLVSRNDVIVYDWNSHACIIVESSYTRLRVGKVLLSLTATWNGAKKCQFATRKAEAMGILVITEGLRDVWVGNLGNCEAREKYNFRP